MKSVTVIFKLLLLLTLVSLRAEEVKSNTCYNRMWLEGEYLYWWMKNSPSTVPIVEEGPVAADGTPMLGAAGYTTVLGGKKIHNDPRSGFRISTGYRFNSSQLFGLEGDYVYLYSGTDKHSISSNGNASSPFYAVPFYDVTKPGESSDAIALPNTFGANAILKVKNSMQDAEFNGSFRVFKNSSWIDLQVLVGFLWWNFKEKLTFDTYSPYLSSYQPNNVYETKDVFQTNNNFYGGQTGIRSLFCFRSFTFQTSGKVALGGIGGRLKIYGSLVTNDYNNFSTPLGYSGGYFAEPTNIGHSTKTHFSIIPQFNARFGYDIVEGLNLHLGYTFLYVTKVMWASNQIDRNINPTQSVNLQNSATSVVLVGEAAPKPLYNTASFWTQGLNVGLRFQY